MRAKFLGLVRRIERGTCLERSTWESGPGEGRAAAGRKN
jgi:hypothetical protein